MTNPSSPKTIMLVDDDPDLLRLLSMRLKASGYEVCLAASAEEALAQLPMVHPALVVTDLRMGGMDGMRFFEHIRSVDSFLPVIIMTAHGSIPEAVSATQKGVFSFLTKPLEGKTLLRAVEEALSLGAQAHHAGPTDQEWCRDIIHQSRVMMELLTQARLVAEGRSNILIQGDSGTGKELLAKAIHRASPRRDRPFVAVNCAAIPEPLLESELFGHVKGSFTGAVRDHRGVIRAADTGTLFLDEIGDTPPSFQVKMLRVIQDRTLRPVGANEAVAIDVRLISATHRSLEQMVEKGQFREDLYYRVNVVCLKLPSLAERPEDIPLLAGKFLQELATRANKRIHGFSQQAMEMLIAAPWPGNIRQLYNVIEHAVALATTPLIPADLVGGTINKGFTRFPTFAEARLRFEQDYLISLLKLTEGNVSQAARIADRNRTDFYKLLQRNHIVPTLFKKE